MMDLTNTLAQRYFDKEGCQWIGPDQDPMKHHPIKMCGCPVVEKTAYCEEHLARMYIGGVPKKKKTVVKKQQWEPGELEDMFQEAYDELVASGEIEA
jgi:hypothetical protein